MFLQASNEILYAAVATSCGVLLFCLENIFPLRKRSHNLIKRLLVNFSMALLTFFTAWLTVQPIAKYCLNWSEKNSIGFLHQFKFNPWVGTLIGFILLDLSFYYWHVLNHKSRFLWRFHNVHHLDPELDVSTGFRFHWGEIVLSTIFRAIQILMIGPSLNIFLAYGFLLQVATFFHHSNLALPSYIDRIIKVIFVTPRMHTIHHSKKFDESFSNFSVVFSIWDRLHRTFIERHEMKNLKIGVPAYSYAGDNKLINLMRLPFVKQRDYWKDSSRHD